MSLTDSRTVTIKRRKMPKTFRSLRHPAFRWFAFASLSTNTAIWMQRIVQDWLAVTVGGDGLSVGVTTALQFLPILLAGPLAGAIADRMPRKWLLLISGSLMAAPSLVLGLSAAYGAVTIWHIYASALVLGIGSAIDTPIRTAFIRDLLGKDDFVNGIGLSAVIFHTSRIIGPAAAGALIAISGVPVSLFAVCAVFLLAITALLPIRTVAEEADANEAAAPPGPATALNEFRRQPGLIVITALAAIVAAFTLNFQITITLMATQVFALDAAGFGRLSSMMAVASILGALLVARLSRPSYLVVIGSAGLLGLAYCVAVGAQTPVQFALALVPIGLLSNFYLASSTAAVQIRVDRKYQGRISGLYLAGSFALVPIGAVLIGYAADFWSPRGPLFVAGVLCVGAALATYAILLKLGVIQWKAGRVVDAT
jgi:MFS family permease